jgi:hypothetical protein
MGIRAVIRRKCAVVAGEQHQCQAVAPRVQPTVLVSIFRPFSDGSVGATQDQTHNCLRAADPTELYARH